jgi:hypothetical protein
MANIITIISMYLYQVSIIAMLHLIDLLSSLSVVKEYLA